MMTLWQATVTSKHMLFASGRVRLCFERTGGVLHFTGVHATGGQGASAGYSLGSSCLWRVELRDRLGYARLLDGSEADAFTWKTGRRLRLIWDFETLRVEATVAADEDATLTRWRLRVINRSRAHTVWHVEFPVFKDVLGPGGSHRKDVLISPEGFGCAIPDPIHQKQLSVWPRQGYPTGIQTMGFLGLLNGGTGFYLGAHDPALAPKDFIISPDAARDTLGLAIGIPPADSTRAQGEVRLNYDTVIGLFDGDWYDAARIYRAHAIRQSWYPRPIAGRPDIPAWAKRMPLWVQSHPGGTPHSKADAIARRAELFVAFRAALGVDIGMHLYNWHQNPFDIHYPSYLPRAGVSRMIAKLQGGGVRVMPYINGRLFDPDNPDWLRDKARRAAVKLAGAKLHARAEHLMMEDYGSHALFAAMCPHAAYWQKKIASVVADLVQRLRVDGVYIDQVAACGPSPCADPSHGHPLRGGGWWVDAYARMFARIRRTVRPLCAELLLTTECNAEGYAGFIGGFLMWHSLRNYVIPLYPAVYGGRTLLFGRSPSVTDRAAFRICAAQNLLWGCQMGWFNETSVELLLTETYAGERVFLKRLCAMYERLQEHLLAGAMLRPPGITGDVGSVNVQWTFCGEWAETLPAVQGSRWARNGRVATVVINADDKPHAVRVGRPVDSGEITDIVWMDNAVGAARHARRSINLALPALSGVILMSQTHQPEAYPPCSPASASS